MKKILAILLAAMMLLSFAACNPANLPSGTDSTEQGENNNRGGENNNGEKSVAWPSKVSDIAWTGSGKIICVEDVTGSSMGEVEIYIESAALDELGAYVEMLKGKGITGDAAPTSFSDGYCSWRGNEGAIKITLYETSGPERGYVDGAYKLLIRIQTDAACFK